MITFVTNPFFVGFPVGQPGAGFSAGATVAEAQGAGTATAAAFAAGDATGLGQGVATIEATGSSSGAGIATADSPFVVDGADFDGINDYMTRGAGLTGAADSKLGIFSAWLRLDGGDGVAQYLLEGTNRVAVTRRNDNKISVIGTNAAGVGVMTLVTNATYAAGASWIHVLASWDMAGGVGGRHLYINGVSDLDVVTFTDDTIDYTVADWTIATIGAGSFKLDGCLAEFYFAPGQYLDFSVVANRRKFFKTSSQPAFLGATGSLPTGVAPLVYQHLDDGEAVANFATNRGTGGNFTITSVLATASSSPSD